MDELTSVALAGTARLTQPSFATGTPIDAALIQADFQERERALLLTAGALAIYRDAGYVPARNADPLPAPALPETQRVCSPKTAVLLETLLKHHQELLPAALERMIQQQLRLPAELLPIIFRTRIATELRPALRHIIGERGHWLAQFHTQWAWASEAPIMDTYIPDDATRIWEEGGPAQRLEVLRLVRANDPPAARSWIAHVWAEEKADFRVQMLAICSLNLSGDDEPFLERALADRVEKVRLQAAAVALLLPTSALAQRMLARADTLLTWADETLQVNSPAAMVADPSWVRDGMDKEGPRTVSQTDWAVQSVVQRVPLAHWQERFGTTPTQLIAAAEKTDHSDAIVHGWIEALTLGSNSAWIAPLWNWWANGQHSQHFALIIRHMTAAEAEMRALEWMPHLHNEETNWVQLVNSLPAPWSDHFGKAYLKQLHDYLAHRSPDGTLITAWIHTFIAMGMSLPASCFAVALVPLPPITDSEQHLWQVRQWYEQWAVAIEVISLRHRILEEIA